MMIDYSYFFGKIYLPHQNNSESRQEVNRFCEIYEPDYLKRALGYELYKAFEAGTVGSGEFDERWSNLVFGAEFTYNGELMHWTGFDPSTKLTPVANYIYYRWQENKATDSTLVGTAVQKLDNNSRVNSERKMIDAWNDMVEKNTVLWKFLKVNKSDYPEWDDRCQKDEIFFSLTELGI